jgi:hypothetical protein
LPYQSKCCIGVNTDAGAVPDPEVLSRFLVESFEEILDLGGPHPPVRLLATT